MTRAHPLTEKAVVRAGLQHAVQHDPYTRLTVKLLDRLVKGLEDACVAHEVPVSVAEAIIVDALTRALPDHDQAERSRDLLRRQATLMAASIPKDLSWLSTPTR